jgi:outer membrane protein assembly factor BamA
MTVSRGFAFLAVLAVAGAAAAQPAAPIAEILVHGNHSTPDADVIAVSGLALGQPAGDADLAAAQDRLEASGRFQSTEVRRRARSISDPDDVLVLILVEELPGTSPDLPTPGWLRRTTAGLMWAPVVSYREGYGFTYGVRIAAADLFGERSTLSVPLTWGGERRAGLQLERSFERGPVSRIVAVGDIVRIVNPAFDQVDQRFGGEARVESAVTSWLRLAAIGSLADVEFGGDTTRLSTAGGEIALDTRLDPTFPRNAVWVTAGVERLGFSSTSRVRQRIDGNAALGLFRGSALIGRVFQVSADDTLPPFEQTWIGGAASLRGFRAGYRVDDNAAGASVTYAYPLGSPLNLARFGLRTFVDWAAVYPAKTSWQDAAYDRGIGGGVFFSATAVSLSLDVAWSDTGNVRGHFRMGTRF